MRREMERANDRRTASGRRTPAIQPTPLEGPPPPHWPEPFAPFKHCDDHLQYMIAALQQAENKRRREERDDGRPEAG